MLCEVAGEDYSCGVMGACSGVLWVIADEGYSEYGEEAGVDCYVVEEDAVVGAVEPGDVV